MAVTRLLITGCHHSGTTLRAAMIGCHRDVSICNEDHHDGWRRVIGKQIVGVKAVIPSVTWHRRRRLLYTVLIRKVIWLQRRLLPQLRIGCIAHYCIDDFLHDGKVIMIYRSHKGNIDSILRHSRQSRRGAHRDCRRARRIRQGIKGNANVLTIHLNHLTASPEFVCRRICYFLGIEYDGNMLNGYKHTPFYENNKIEIKK